jgi:hypothetical protein
LSITRLAVPTTVANQSIARSLSEFKSNADPDWTNAFIAAAAWSHTNKRPVFVPESATAYLVTAPIVLDSDTKFFSTHIPAWSPEPNNAIPATVISPTTGFPNNRGLFEIAVGTASGRSTGLQGLALRGAGFGTNVHGIVMPGITNIPELGTTLADLDISNFTGDGIRGGARVSFVRKVFIHECLGYGFNMNQPWNDSRIQWLYCFYNKAGGLNIDGQSQQTTILQSRFERSGQVPYEFNPAASRWNAAAPGIRIRAGSELTVYQCDTDANNGPGLDIAVESATPTTRPQNIGFIGCNFIRDGQGAGDVASTTSTGVKIHGFANTGGQTVPSIQLLTCSVQVGPAADDGSTTAQNPARALWIENTEFVDVDGGSFFGTTATYYFGGGADPVSSNWQLYFRLPQDNILMLPNQWVDTPFHSVGMLRYNVNTTALEKWNGTAWYPAEAKYVFPLTDAATVTTDAANGPYFRLTAAGNRTLAAPTNPIDGQTCTWEHIASGGARTLALTTGSAGSFKFGTTITALTATTSGLRDLITCTYSAGLDRWMVRTVEKGF